MPLPIKKGKRKSINIRRKTKQRATSSQDDAVTEVTASTLASDSTEQVSVVAPVPVEDANFMVVDNDNHDEDASNGEDEDDNKELGSAYNKKLLDEVLEKEHANCISISYFHVVIYKYMPPEDWKANNLIGELKAKLHIPQGTNIKPILKDTWLCLKKGTKYERGTYRSKSGRKATVTTKSMEAPIIADCLEAGQSQRLALQ